MTDLNDVRLIAFYLPQYHPIPENDLWWGKGFTEWMNVAKAKPNFEDHYQPHYPADLGFYDLRLPEVREQQATLAKEYGVSGFCYYYYWFNSKRLLNRPLDEILESKKPDFPFCICWANENWTRRWDGLENEILIAQNYSLEDNVDFIRNLFPVFRDQRYIRVNGKPLLLVYRISLLPNPVETAQIWRDECLAAGIGEIYLCAVQSFDTDDPRTHGFDASVEFPPLGLNLDEASSDVKGRRADFQGSIWNYQQAIESSLKRPQTDYKLFKTVMPSWDNTARRQDNSNTFIYSSPESYGFWLTQAVKKTKQRYLGDEKLIFINAWNEWAEGCHLEPDKKYGHQFLQATRNSLEESLLEYQLLTPATEPQETHHSTESQNLPLVSVCIPTYNGERFLREALSSIACQTYACIEVIVSDDCSTDKTIDILKEFQSQYSGVFLIFTHRQYGLVENWNFCINRANGKYIKFLFQDDLLAPTCIEEMVALAEKDKEVGLVFSPRTMLLDSSGEKDEVCKNIYDSCGDLHENWSSLKPIQPGKDLLNDPVLVRLLTHNMIGEPSTVLIRRECFFELGLFDTDLHQVIDIDMWYRIMGHYNIGFIDKPLSTFRVHSAQESRKNAASGNSDQDVIRLWQKMISPSSYNFLPEVLKHAAQQNLLTVGINQSEILPSSDISIQLRLAQAEIERLNTRVAAIESSKFWQLRKWWFRFKRSIGHGKNE